MKEFLFMLRKCPVRIPILGWKIMDTYELHSLDGKKLNATSLADVLIEEGKKDSQIIKITILEEA